MQLKNIQKQIINSIESDETTGDSLSSIASFFAIVLTTSTKIVRVLMNNYGSIKDISIAALLETDEPIDQVNGRSSSNRFSITQIANVSILAVIRIAVILLLTFQN